MTTEATPGNVPLNAGLGRLPERAGILSGCTSTPPFVHLNVDGYTAEQMLSYAAAAVAAERERLIKRVRQIGMYECGCKEDAQHCEELANQLQMEHTGADWPDRRTTSGPNVIANRPGKARDDL